MSLRMNKAFAILLAMICFAHTGCTPGDSLLTPIDEGRQGESK